MRVYGDEEIDSIGRVLRSGSLSRYQDGEESETEILEREWSEFIGAQHSLAVTSGTAALICGLVGLGIQPGDEVILPGYTYVASALACLAIGAVPVVAEINDSLALDPESIDRVVTPRTKAVMPVHMHGLPCDLASLGALAREHGLSVLEDASQAAGGAYRGRRLGTHGNAGVFSFNVHKIISCGEGGMLITNDEGIYEAALAYHDGGAADLSRASQLRIPFSPGTNFRFNNVLSALLRVQVKYLDSILRDSREWKKILWDELDGRGAYSMAPVNDRRGDCSTVLGLQFSSAKRAQQFVSRLLAQGIECFRPINTERHVYTNWPPYEHGYMPQKPRRDRGTDPHCPRTLRILSRTVLLTVRPWVEATDSAQMLLRMQKAVKEDGRY
jgi:8-amino-3,8-dideoxy-alpha-D-manno-octulosonate transaminase